jgi:drug/metabolite transporter (DMT)-like permease
MQNIRSLFYINIGFLIYSLATVLAKVNSLVSKPLSLQFFVLIAVQFMMVSIYSVMWQLNIKYIDLNKAYIFKGTTIIWGMIFAQFVFKEQISLQNIIGVIIIIIGMIWGMQNE